MTTSEAFELDDITTQEAKALIAEHVIDETFTDFQNEYGVKAFYTGDEVLGWLGY